MIQIDVSIPIPVLEMKMWSYWSNRILEFIIYIYIYLNKNWKIYWSKQSFTSIGPKDQCSSWGLPIFWIRFCCPQENHDLSLITYLFVYNWIISFVKPLFQDNIQICLFSIQNSARYVLFTCLKRFNIGPDNSCCCQKWWKETSLTSPKHAYNW